MRIESCETLKFDIAKAIASMMNKKTLGNARPIQNPVQNPPEKTLQ